MDKKNLLLMSGGMDSTILLHYLMKKENNITCIAFDYKQRNIKEIEAAKKICLKYKIDLKIINIGFLSEINTSHLLNKTGNMNDRHILYNNLHTEFITNRNLLFLLIAHSYAQHIKAENIYIAICDTTGDSCPDVSPDIIKLNEITLNKNSNCKIDIKFPFAKYTKKDLWEWAFNNNCMEDIINLSYTCHNNSSKKNIWGYGCDNCPVCKLRKDGYEDYVLSKKENKN